MEPPGGHGQRPPSAGLVGAAALSAHKLIAFAPQICGSSGYIRSLPTSWTVAL
jgi:hypothetical protein